MRKIIVIGAVAFALAGCEHVSSDTTNRLVSFGADAYIRSEGQVPSPSDPVAFADTDQFDLQLYSALSADQDVTVTIADQSTRDALPQRFDLWLKAVRNSNGRVSTCDITQDPQLGGGLLAFAVDLGLGWVRRKIREYALYNPARSMNAIVEVDPANSSVRSVRFVNRSTSFTGLLDDRAKYSRCV